MITNQFKVRVIVSFFLKVKIPLSLSVLLYLIGIIVGIIIKIHSDVTSNSELLKYLVNYTGIYSEELQNIGFKDIMLNNLSSIGLTIIGSFILGISTFIQIFFNGYVIGVITVMLHNSPVEALFFILPHGIFEIPAIIIAGAAGFKIPYEITKYLAGKKDQILTKEDIKEYGSL